jgi:hypothetical protein
MCILHGMFMYAIILGLAAGFLLPMFLSSLKEFIAHDWSKGWYS